MIFCFRVSLALLSAGLLSACAVDRTVGAAPTIEVTDLDELPAPKEFGYYTIGGQEKLNIQVVGSDLLSGIYLTDGGGSIGFPLLGNLQLGGMSPGEASRLIEGGLQERFLKDPKVRIVPDEFPQPSISVGGQVREPGSYPATGNQSLLRLVNAAKGLSEYAKHDDVLVMRSVQGQSYIGVFNIAAIERGNYPDPKLYPNDIVMVGDSPGRRRLDNLLQFVPLLSSSAIIIDRLGR